MQALSYTGLVLAGSLMAGALNAATITVSSTSDTSDPNDGQCTLREAITAANNNTASGSAVGECAAGEASPDTIEFSIPGAGVHTIQPASALPTILHAVTIDGTTQPGATCASWPPTLRIEIDGSNISAFTSGLAVNGGGSTLKGLVINRFSGVGVDLNSAGNTLQCNFIGTDPTGTNARPNADNGILVDADNNLIGTNGDGIGDASEGNLISGNAVVGIFLRIGNSTHVAGNRIGTAVNGTTALPNDSGLLIDSSDNLIGTDGNDPNDRVERNVISGNTGVGIFLRGGSGNRVAGNFIGTDITGGVAMANDGGLLVDGDSNIIGTNSDGVGDAIEGNVISGNTGIGIFFRNGSSNTIRGNWIGTDPQGTAHLGNNGSGILIRGANGNVVGSDGNDPSADAEVNTIAFNPVGVQVTTTSGSTQGNRIRRNSIHDNDGLGIDLGNGVVTPNDPNDTDTGPNGLQNFPVLNQATSAAGTTSVGGVLDSVIGSTYLVDVYANPSCDSSGFGEGQTYLGAIAVPIVAPGGTSFSGNLPVSVQSGFALSATATDANGSTSEFSNCVTVNATPTPTVLPTATATPTSTQPPTATVTATSPPATTSATPSGPLPLLVCLALCGLLGLVRRGTGGILAASGNGKLGERRATE